MCHQVTSRNASRPDFHHEDHVAHIAVLPASLSPDDGTLTRTMKPRRAAILAKYEQEVARLTAKLRG